MAFASDERRKSYIKTLHLSIPSFPIARGLTPPDVAVQQGKDQETQRRDRKETRLTTQFYFTGPKKVSISRAQPPPTCPRHGFVRIKFVMYVAV